ncbi:MAG: hypothetical protein ABIV94_03385, partial [Acidimicrobiales bacterium]
MLRSAATTDLDAATLYAILRLRSEVFVVEQACAYLDADGRDLEPGCRQVWIEEHGTDRAGPTSPPGEAEIGRDREGHDDRAGPTGPPGEAEIGRDREGPRVIATARL